MDDFRAIWILLPAFNEEDSLPKLLPKIATELTGKCEYHIVVVDDGSIDRTAEALERYTSEYPLTVVTHSLNRGLGETERDGFEYVAAHCGDDDVIVRLDCDDTHEVSYVWTMIERLKQGFDVVNTSRFQPGGGQVGVSNYRAFISRGANLFMSAVFRIRGVRDYSCGFRAYRARIIKDAIAVFGNQFIQLRGLGFTSTLEMIVKLRILGCRFAEVPFVLRYDQKLSSSKMVSSITTFGYLTMAVLSYWPFGGWIRQYRGLSRLYQSDRAAALEKYGRARVLQRFVSRISF
ncbi:MAG TPA: glycosyltransferase [Thermoanaerobaculia bacterium]|nr:glycosyltransferase [Thermoanaerobaculia bacterium]